MQGNTHKSNCCASPTDSHSHSHTPTHTQLTHTVLNMAQKREALARQRINQKFTESGEKERLQELLRVRLIECGWREEVHFFINNIIPISSPPLPLSSLPNSYLPLYPKSQFRPYYALIVIIHIIKCA